MKNVLKKIKEYFTSVGIGQATLFRITEYHCAVYLICFTNLLNIITRQEEVVYTTTLIFTLFLYLSISIKHILKVFQNKEINDIMNGVLFIEYLTFIAYFGVTYTIWLLS